MKNLKILLGIYCCMQALSSNAKNYYFSSSAGNDNRTIAQAQNVNTPWKTIQQLNTIMNQLLPGDSVLFKRGDTFDGGIVINKSGSLKYPVVFGAYGTGSKPIINGFATVSSFTETSKGIFESNVLSTGLSVNMVAINSINTAMGRYPNANAANGGYMNFEAHGTNSITDNQLTDTINWKGAQLVIRSARWILDKMTINNRTGSTLSYDPASAYTPVNGYGYFIQNDRRTLDQPGEWYYNPATKKISIFFGASVPPGVSVQVSATANLLTFNASFVVVENLQFLGANNDAIANTGNLQNITVKNCTISYTGANALSFSGNTVGITVDSCTIKNSNNNAIILPAGCVYARVTKNIIQNTGIYPGMGKNGDGNHLGVRCDAKGFFAEYNKIIKTGFNALSFTKDSCTIKNNFIDTFCFVKDDGAGIYTYTGPSNTVYYGRKITGNIVLNGIGAPYGVDVINSYLPAVGIYLDDNATNVEVTGNTVANCANNGITVHNARNFNLSNNTFYNNFAQFATSHGNSGDPITGGIIKNNVFVSKLATQHAASFFSTSNDAANIGVFDNNIYARPILDSATIKMEFPNMGWGYRTLAYWKSYSGKDNLSTRGKVKLLPYVIDSMTSTNKIANGTFKDDISGIETFSSKNSSIIYHDISKLDNGSAKIEGADNFDAIVKVTKINSAKKYVLRFTATSSIDFNMEIYIRKSIAPFTVLSTIQTIKLSAARKDYEIVINNPVTDASPCIILGVKNTPITFWLDNLEFMEADMSAMTPDKAFRFEYNATALNKKITLNGYYLGVDSTVYNDTLTLAPFSSKVLLKSNRPNSPSADTNSVLPVKLIKFSVDNSKQATANVSWITDQEINSSHYTVERSSDGKDFLSLGTLPSNNKTTVNHYQFTDQQPLQGISYYRLVMVDKDGSKEYSNIVSIRKNAKSITINQIILSGTTLRLQVGSNVKQLMQCNVTDVSGRLFFQKNIVVEKGINNITNPLPALAKSIYYVNLVGSGENVVKPVVNN